MATPGSDGALPSSPRSPTERLIPPGGSLPPVGCWRAPDHSPASTPGPPFRPWSKKKDCVWAASPRAAPA